MREHKMLCQRFATVRLSAGLGKHFFGPPGDPRRRLNGLRANGLKRKKPGTICAVLNLTRSSPLAGVWRIIAAPAG